METEIFARDLAIVKEVDPETIKEQSILSTKMELLITKKHQIRKTITRRNRKIKKTKRRNDEKIVFIVNNSK